MTPYLTINYPCTKCKGTGRKPDGEKCPHCEEGWHSYRILPQEAMSYACEKCNGTAEAVSDDGDGCECQHCEYGCAPTVVDWA